MTVGVADGVIVGVEVGGMGVSVGVSVGVLVDVSVGGTGVLLGLEVGGTGDGDGVIVGLEVGGMSVADGAIVGVVVGGRGVMLDVADGGTGVLLGFAVGGMRVLVAVADGATSQSKVKPLGSLTIDQATKTIRPSRKNVTRLRHLRREFEELRGCWRPRFCWRDMPSISCSCAWFSVNQSSP